MANSSVPTLPLDGRDWKIFWASLLELTATKGLLGVLSGQEPDNKSSQWEGTDALLKVLFYQTVPVPLVLKPIKALRNNKMHDELKESCLKPSKLTVEPPMKEKLKDGHTKASSEDKAEAAVVPSEWHMAWNELHRQPSLRAGKPLKSEHTKVLSGMAEILDEVENVNRMAKEDLPLKPCNESTTNDVPSAYALLLEGEQAACPSGTVRQEESLELWFCTFGPILIILASCIVISCLISYWLLIWYLEGHPTIPSAPFFGAPHYQWHNKGWRKSGTLQWLTESSQEVENDESVPSMPTGHVEKVHGSMKQHCCEHKQQQDNLQGHMNTLKVLVRGVEGEMAGGDVEPRDGKDNMTSSGNVNSDNPTRLPSQDVEEDELNSKLQRLGEGKRMRKCTKPAIPQFHMHKKGIGTSRNLTIKPMTIEGGPEAIQSWHSVNMNVSSQMRGPEGQEEANRVFRDFEDEHKHQTDGAMSSTYCNLKQAETKLLAEEKTGEDQQQQHKPRNMPGPPTRLQKHTYELTRLRCQCRQIKSKSREVRRKWKGKNMYQGCGHAIAHP
ncbi:hypothetical protein EDD16DRAFT_1526924 [Pisolithus croceorrhizus]|nr:hypothetical protein EDD16DRAFT_1526924 [Pisolithus croceorrhizus]KAI6131748.1 hypothetical protein EV401DRAFT_1883954 [Pisolithus croceorrhizus]